MAHQARWVAAATVGLCGCSLLFPFEDRPTDVVRACEPTLATAGAEKVIDRVELAAPAPGQRVTDPLAGVEIVRVTEAGPRVAYAFGPARPQRSPLSLGNEWLLLFRYADDAPTMPVLYRFDPDDLSVSFEADLPSGETGCYAEDAAWSQVERGVLLCHYGDVLYHYHVETGELVPATQNIPDTSGRDLYAFVTSDDDSVLAFTGNASGGGPPFAFVVDTNREPPSSFTLEQAGSPVAEVLPTPDGSRAVVQRDGELFDWDFRGGAEPPPWMPSAIAYPSVGDGFLIGQDSEGGGALVRVTIGGPDERRVLARLLAGNRLDDANTPWGSSLVHHDDRWALATVLADEDFSGARIPWAGLVLAVGTDPGSPFAVPLFHHRGAPPDAHAIPSYDGRFVVFSSLWAGASDVYVAALPTVCR